MEKEPRDLKFIIGMIILVGAVILMMGAFWTTVADQAEKDRIAQQNEERKLEESAISAITMETGDLLKKQVFVNMDTMEAFRAKIPKEGIYNRAGTLIKGDVLEYGDMVKIYTDGAHTDEEIPLYTNVIRMERTGRADLETAQKYEPFTGQYAGS